MNSLGVAIDPDLLITALTHRSFSNENGGVENNERLEFLGDTVLQFVITNKIYSLLEGYPEGRLTRIRSAIVSQKPLADVARKLGVGPLILLGKGEELGGGRDKDSILSDTLEALFAAIYLTSGLEVATDYILKHLAEIIEETTTTYDPLEPKGALQEFANRHGYNSVDYEYETTGPEHAKEYLAKVYLDGSETAIATATASNRKQASIKAAKYALKALKKSGK